MKNCRKLIFLVLVGILVSGAVSAQPYKSIFGKDSTTWHIAFLGWDWFGTDSLRYVKDTNINLLDYKIVRQIERLPETPEAYFIREDTLAGKWWIINKDAPSKEYLFMDLNLNIGDTIHFPYGYDAVTDTNAIVDSIAYIDGAKYLYTNSYKGPLVPPARRFTMIEGIGPNWGFNYFFEDGLSVSSFALICLHKDGQLYYHTNPYPFPEFFDCVLYGGASIQENERQRSLLIYPNPAVNSVTFNLDESLGYTISIRNIYNQNMKTIEAKGSPTLNISISDLSSGLYFISCITRNSIESGYFIKM